MLAAAARADKSRCFCCESDFKIVSPASSVSLAVVCARSNVSERVSALETEFTSASLRSSSLSTAKEFLPPPPPPPLDSTSKFPRDDDFSNCARVRERERERERRVSLEDGPPRNADDFRALFEPSPFDFKATLCETKETKRKQKSSLLRGLKNKRKMCTLLWTKREKYIYSAYRCGLLFSSSSSSSSDGDDHFCRSLRGRRRRRRLSVVTRRVSRS